MSSTLIISVITIYFSALLIISYFTSRKADSNAFFMANRQAPWYLVAFGMIGTSLSGVTFISVPGNVVRDGFAYYGVIMGNIVGYLVIALVLMPLYYRLNLISIYTYLEQRFGFWSYKTGAFIFIVSRTIGSSLRLFLAAAVLQTFLFSQFNIPFWITSVVTILLIWVYTFKGGIKTIVWTDAFQTIFLVSSVIISVYIISQKLDLSLVDLISTVNDSSYSQIFFWDPLKSNFFLKNFIGGAFIAICVTGLDQDLMQKNLSCKNIHEAQKNMFSFMTVMAVIVFLFLMLGALLYIYAANKGIALPDRTDSTFPTLAFSEFGTMAGVFFLLGITASSYASSDSALAALTTSFCIDFLNFKDKPEAQKQKEKFYVHIGFSLAFLIIIIIFNEAGNTSIIGTVLKMAGFTYGPLLGLFSFGMFTRRMLREKLVPVVCIASPIICWVLDLFDEKIFGGYQFGYEILLLNGVLTFVGLWAISIKSKV